MGLTAFFIPAALLLLACACALLVWGLRQRRRGMTFSAPGIPVSLPPACAVMMEFITRPL